MKKAYNTPVIEIQNISAATLLANSIGVDTSIDTNTQYSREHYTFEDIDDEF